MRKLKNLIVIILCFFFSSTTFSANKDSEEQEVLQKITLNLEDTIIGCDNTKGQISLHLSFPYINNFHLSPESEGSKTNTGFMGYSVGLDYCYKPNQYINLSFSQIQDFFLPIAFVDRGDEYELMSSYNMSLTNNHKVNRFSLGYGMAFSRNSWELRNLFWDENSSTREPVKKNNSVLGLSFSTYYQLSQNFYLGMIYKPTFLRLNSDPTFKYEHTISIDIAWKIKLSK